MRYLFLLILLTFNISIAGASARLFSMNLHCFKDHWEKRLEHILKQVVIFNPDIIALQEVCVDKKRDMRSTILRTLEQLTGREWFGESLYTHLAWATDKEYLMVITKKQPEAVVKEFLPHSFLRRGFIAVNLDKTWFVNLHLAFNQMQSQNRLSQINYLVDRFQGSRHILMGDFNSGPADPEQQNFHKKGYRSFFPAYSYPSHGPDRTIDGFWISPGLAFDSGVLHSYFKHPVDGLYMSDHLGVSLELIRK